MVKVPPTVVVDAEGNLISLPAVKHLKLLKVVLPEMVEIPAPAKVTVDVPAVNVPPLCVKSPLTLIKALFPLYVPFEILKSVHAIPGLPEPAFIVPLLCEYIAHVKLPVPIPIVLPALFIVMFLFVLFIVPLPVILTLVPAKLVPATGTPCKSKVPVVMVMLPFVKLGVPLFTSRVLPPIANTEATLFTVKILSTVTGVADNVLVPPLTVILLNVSAFCICPFPVKSTVEFVLVKVPLDLFQLPPT
jgi:hypothetical protein